MTKLEEKLIEMGYKKTTYFDINDVIWWKGSIAIATKKRALKILRATVQVGYVDDQSQIDDLQQAFNVLQNDLEILNELERKENLKECMEILNRDFWD